MQAVRPESESQVAAMFDRIAPGYDLLNRLLSAGQDARWRRALVAELPQISHLQLLDIATGTGDVLIAAARRFPKGSFLGVDISGEMLKIADKKFVEQCKEAITSGADFQTQIMSMERLQLPDETFDAVSISFGLRNVVDKIQGIAEAFRVLKPGGRFLVLEFFLPRSSILGGLFQFYFRHVLPRIGALLSDRQAYSYLPASVMGFYHPKRMAEVLLESGFRSVQSSAYLFGAVHLFVAEK